MSSAQNITNWRADLAPGMAPQDRMQSDQMLRQRRLLMSFISYMVTGSLVAFCWYQGMVPASVAIQFATIVLIINGLFLLIIRTNLNLRFRDPSMTRIQMVASLLPALWVMYFLEAGQARAGFLLITIVPALYGILALNTRQFLTTSFLFIALYGGLMGVLWWRKPEVLDGELELFQLLALLLVMSEIAIIGGFIHSLREKLRFRNLELKDAMHELNEAMEKINDMARRDSLTGLFNRRYLFEFLALETSRQQRAHGPFSICIIDVDYFKRINDEYGHQAGDEALKAIADEVGQNMRNIDCFGRYGGEEFLMVLPQTDLGGAMIKAERVRKAVQALELSHLGKGCVVTVSIGVAEHLADENVDETIHRADTALYRAKEGGRNRVVSISGGAE